MNLVTSFNGYKWTCINADTYDGAEDAGPLGRMIGLGDTREQAIADWQEQYAEYMEEHS